VIKAEIDAALASRNAAISGSKVVKFIRICDFEYDDGTKMVTLVGMFAAEEDYERVLACGFRHLDFMPPSGRTVRITVPKLTNREIRALEQQLPTSRGGKIERRAIPADEARAFASLYRYLPNFAVLES
jgi:hypothetical protein